MPTDSTIEALAEEWWRKCQARRCASGRADADERELLLNALGVAAGGVSRLLGRVGAPGGDPGPAPAVIDSDSPGATNLQDAAPPINPSSPAVHIERRRILAAAASRWGARVGSPVLVVEQLVQLRVLVAAEPGHKAITRLIDLTIINACRGATDELQRAAFSAKSAPENPGVPRASTDRSTSSANGILRVCTRKISSRPRTSGRFTTTPVKTPRPQQRRIKYIRTVCRRHQNDAFVGFKAVHLDQQLVQSLLTLVVSAA